MKKMIWGITAVLVLLSAFAIGGIVREIGKVPAKAELDSYGHLPYFKNGRFQNQEPVQLLYGGDDKDEMSLAKILFSSPHNPKRPLPQKELKHSSFGKDAGNNAVYWLGHSSAILELNGKRIGVDLVFDNASPIPFTVRRFQKPPLDRSELPELDYILLTHNHYDHLERKTVQRIKKGHFIVPYGVKQTLSGWGIGPERITEIGWGESFEEGGIKITAVEGIHFSGRSLSDNFKSLWNSYIIKTPRQNIFWGGDSGYGKHFAEIGDKHGPFDWAALEIDAWNGRWPDIHLFPEQAVQAALDLKAARLLPIHWGAYDLGYHQWDTSINRVTEAAGGKPLELMTPAMGEKLLPGVTPTAKWWLL